MQVLVPKRFRTDSEAAGAPPTPSQSTQPITNMVKGRRRAGGPPPGPVQPIPEVRIHQEPTPLFSYLYGYLRSFYDFVLMASFVPFLVYFMLSWRDHMRRTFLYLFSGADRQAAHKTWESIAEAARAYVLGNFLLGLVLSVVGAGFFVTIRMPYWLLVGVLSGFLSLVPYVGLPLAIIPAFAAGLTVYNSPAVYVLIAVVLACLHLLAVNVLYPKIVGSRLHLNPLVITIALMFWAPCGARSAFCWRYRSWQA